MPSSVNGTISGGSTGPPKVHRIERSGRTQRSVSGRTEPAPQRIDFGHGKLRKIGGSRSAIRSAVARPLRSITAT